MKGKAKSRTTISECPRNGLRTTSCACLSKAIQNGTNFDCKPQQLPHKLNYHYHESNL